MEHQTPDFSINLYGNGKAGETIVNTLKSIIK